MPFLTAEFASSQFGQISVTLFILTVLSTLIIKRRLSQLHGLPFPPGPKPRPFVGNAHDIPATKPWITYANWAKQYGMLHSCCTPSIIHRILIGSVIHLRDSSERIIIDNSLKDAINLLEKRSKLYSDRPIPTMVKL